MSNQLSIEIETALNTLASVKSKSQQLDIMHDIAETISTDVNKDTVHHIVNIIYDCIEVVRQ